MGSNASDSAENLLSGSQTASVFRIAFFMKQGISAYEVKLKSRMHSYILIGDFMIGIYGCGGAHAPELAHAYHPDEESQLTGNQKGWRQAQA